MPSLNGFRENFYADSAKASDLIRKGSLSAIAGIWIIANTPKSPTSLFGEHFHSFILSALVFLVAIVCDVLQNIAYTFVGWSAIKSIERKFRLDPTIVDDFPVSKWHRKIGWLFFDLKIFFSTIGVGALIVGLIQVL